MASEKSKPKRRKLSKKELLLAFLIDDEKTKEDVKADAAIADYTKTRQRRQARQDLKSRLMKEKLNDQDLAVFWKRRSDKLQVAMNTAQETITLLNNELNKSRITCEGLKGVIEKCNATPEFQAKSIQLIAGIEKQFADLSRAFIDLCYGVMLIQCPLLLILSILGIICGPSVR